MLSLMKIFFRYFIAIGCMQWHLLFEVNHIPAIYLAQIKFFMIFEQALAIVAAAAALILCIHYYCVVFWFL